MPVNSGIILDFPMNYWVTIYRMAFGTVIVLLTIAVICAFVPKVQRYNESYKKRAEHQEENSRLAEELKKLRDKQERFNSDPSFVERTAREIGMVKPNEIVFKYTNEESKVKKQNQ
ncbi:MAG: septum formation initiator family protein [Kiritimatiellae bacterium]|nr:septum formation initiator family protein [Kiritimatiellia bacterium]